MPGVQPALALSNQSSVSSDKEKISFIIGLAFASFFLIERGHQDLLEFELNNNV